MSMALMAKAMSIKVGNPLRKLVLIKLADNANDIGECWPSISYIADQCEISDRSVQKHIQALSESGLLWIEFRKAEGGKNKSNVYHLTLNNTASPGGESPAPGGESPAPGGESPAPMMGESPAPRTSNSLEPIKEPVKEPKNARKQKNAFSLPAGLNLDAWNLWKCYRSENNLKAYKPVALGEGAAASKLISLAGGDFATQMLIVKQSIENQWQGLFALKQQRTGESKIAQAQRAAEQAIADGRVGYDYDTPFGKR